MPTRPIEMSSPIDMAGLPISTVQDGVNPQDAVNVRQLKAATYVVQDLVVTATTAYPCSIFTLDQPLNVGQDASHVDLNGQNLYESNAGITLSPDRLTLTTYVPVQAAGDLIVRNIVGAAGVSSSYTLPVATAAVLGGVKQGTGVVIAPDGTLSAPVGAPLASYLGSQGATAIAAQAVQQIFYTDSGGPTAQFDGSGNFAPTVAGWYFVSVTADFIETTFSPDSGSVFINAVGTFSTGKNLNDQTGRSQGKIELSNSSNPFGDFYARVSGMFYFAAGDTMSVNAGNLMSANSATVQSAFNATFVSPN